eukprot:TRINITY_DN16998_c0_g1_i1.p1 TRINITY_DN16998_c0_g1~~TRINITY_DN16998_c0_g1_i1.p1  ORF type:complete len:578 (+),score=116.62 TRINITY_DN16998_c0_g1_i1:369-2102(+)
MRYYDQNLSALLAVFKWHATAVQMVLPRTEYWIWILFHIAVTAVVKYVIPPDTIQPFNWGVASSMQFFMTFFVTFYNDMCMHRYHVLYPACCQMKASVANFVQEMSISLHHSALAAYRTTAAKYVLAAVYEYYGVLICGKPSPKLWSELQKKGLLSQEEVGMLRCIETSSGSHVLICWTLLVLQEALRHDAVWPEESTKNPLVVHRYNRLHAHVMQLLEAFDKIGHTVAMPVPYPYYHLMNVVLWINIFVLAIVPALFGSWFTVIPFSMACLVVMGLREVAVALADPFGDDAMDFPVIAFVNRAFDDSVALLEALPQPEARSRALQQVLEARPFTGRELGRECRHSSKLNDPNAGPAHIPTTAWTRDRPLASVPEGNDIAIVLRSSLGGKNAARDIRRPSVVTAAMVAEEAEQARKAADDAVRLRLEEENERVSLLRMEVSALRLQAADLQAQLAAQPASFQAFEMAAAKAEAGARSAGASTAREAGAVASGAKRAEGSKGPAGVAGAAASAGAPTGAGAVAGASAVTGAGAAAGTGAVAGASAVLGAGGATGAVRAAPGSRGSVSFAAGAARNVGK